MSWVEICQFFELRFYSNQFCLWYMSYFYMNLYGDYLQHKILCASKRYQDSLLAVTLFIKVLEKNKPKLNLVQLEW